MANGLKPLVGLCALYLLCIGCSSDHDRDDSSIAGNFGAIGVAGQPAAGQPGTGAGASTGRGGMAASGAPSMPAGDSGRATAGATTAGATGEPPAAVDGLSVYALECHGDSKDCNLGSVPCFGVSSPTPNIAAGWACANRCISNADCSDASSGAEAQASCVPFASAGHCVLVCRNESQSFTCPEGMACYVPPQSPLGYCLWQ